MITRSTSNIALALTKILVICVQVSPSESDRFGKRQLEQLLDDRPDMRSIIRPGEFLYDWLARRFDGGRKDLRVYWHDSEPLSGFDAEHVMSFIDRPLVHNPALIRISSSEKLSAADRCIVLIYEFFNLENEDEFKALYDRAKSGNVTREQYATLAMNLEIKAVVRMQELLKKEDVKKLVQNSPYYQSYLGVREGSPLNNLNLKTRVYYMLQYDVYTKKIK
jgi:hypothetical protein